MNCNACNVSSDFKLYNSFSKNCDFPVNCYYYFILIVYLIICKNKKIKTDFLLIKICGEYFFPQTSLCLCPSVPSLCYIQPYFLSAAVCSVGNKREGVTEQARRKGMESFHTSLPVTLYRPSNNRGVRKQPDRN